MEVDGQIFRQLLAAFEQARRTQDRPTVPAGPHAERQRRVGDGRQRGVARQGAHAGTGGRGHQGVEAQFVDGGSFDGPAPLQVRRPESEAPRERPQLPSPAAYRLGESVATREAFGVALAKLGDADSRVVALDADVKNSTFSDKFEKAHPDRFYQFFIAEQVMVGAAMGLAARGALAFPRRLRRS